jgi:hypothetical protein
LLANLIDDPGPEKDCRAPKQACQRDEPGRLTVIATPLQRALVAPEHAAHVRDGVEREQVNRSDVGRHDKFCESLFKNASTDARLLRAFSYSFEHGHLLVAVVMSVSAET